MIPKFRAWYKQGTLPILTVSQNDYENKTIVAYIEKEAQLETEIEFDLDEVVLMQSTGLFDKNGKEIFDGDVVKFLEESGDEEVSQVSFNDGSFGMSINGLFVAFSMLSVLAQFDYTLEIIGNIHENPELLEVGND